MSWRCMWRDFPSKRCFNGNLSSEPCLHRDDNCAMVSSDHLKRHIRVIPPPLTGGRHQKKCVRFCLSFWSFEKACFLSTILHFNRLFASQNELLGGSLQLFLCRLKKSIILSTLHCMILHFFYKIDLGSWSRGSERVGESEKRGQSCLWFREAKKCPKVRVSLSNVASDAKALYFDIFVLSKEPSFHCQQRLRCALMCLVIISQKSFIFGTLRLISNVIQFA